MKTGAQKNKGVYEKRIGEIKKNKNKKRKMNE